MNNNTIKKLLIIAYAFPPHNVVGAMRPYRFCKYLSKYSNWDTVVLTVNKKFKNNDESLLKELDNKVFVYKTPVFEPIFLYETIKRCI